MKRNLPQTRQQIKQLEVRIDALSLRERAVVFLALLFTLFLMANNVVFSSLRQEQQRLSREVTSKLDELHNISDQTQEIRAKLAQNPEVLAQASIVDLRRRLAVEESSVANIVRGLVSPRDMSRLVQQILSKNQALQVVRVENLPAEPLEEDKPAANATGVAATSKPTPVYKHGMRIELRGRYLDIVRYLRALEAMPSKVFWGEVRFASDEYPYSRVTLVIYTISLNKAWLEV